MQNKSQKITNYNLERRTTEFSKSILNLLRQTAITVVNKNVIFQLSKSATSVGANYREANGAISYKDFRNKIFICKKEIQETEYWLELLYEISNPSCKQQIKELQKEARELTLIFNKISVSVNKNTNQNK